MKEKLYIADSNGTLTFAKQPITGEFAETLTEFANRFKFVVVTGSPWTDMEEQLPAELISNPNVDIWCNMGNTLYREGKEVFDADNTIDFEAFKPILEDVLEACPHKYEVSYPEHFIVSKHSINFSLIGRPEGGEPSVEERMAYEKWDEEVGQRRWVIDYLSKLYPEYNFTFGGQISIDIVKKGCDKTQIVDHYKDYDMSFFGDRIGKLGNDNMVAHVIADIGGCIYSVEAPEETMQIMKDLMVINAKMAEA